MRLAAWNTRFSKIFMLHVAPNRLQTPIDRTWVIVETGTFSTMADAVQTRIRFRTLETIVTGLTVIYTQGDAVARRCVARTHRTGRIEIGTVHRGTRGANTVVAFVRRRTRISVVTSRAVGLIREHAPNRTVAYSVPTLVVQTTQQLLSDTVPVPAERIHCTIITIVAIRTVGLRTDLTDV